MKLSIVIPTLGRVKEVKALLQSVSENSRADFEVIIVDQNFSDVLDGMVTEYRDKGLSIRHYKVDFRGLSKAKNFGIEHAEGEYICFPDDDSTFCKGTIDYALSILDTKEYEIVCGKCVDETGTDSVKLFAGTASALSLQSFEDKFIEATMFFETSCIKRFMYDEGLGIGAFHGAEEGFDIVYRMLNEGVRLFYDPKIVFYHPQVIFGHASSREIRRVFTYRCGYARVCLKHRLTGRYLDRLIKVALYLPFVIIFKRGKTRYYTAELLGLLTGAVVK